MFDLPPKCPAIADKLSGLFGWRHTYEVHEKHKGISHTFLQKSYSLTLPTSVRKPLYAEHNNNNPSNCSSLKRTVGAL